MLSLFETSRDAKVSLDEGRESARGARVMPAMRRRRDGRVGKQFFFETPREPPRDSPRDPPRDAEGRDMARGAEGGREGHREGRVGSHGEAVFFRDSVSGAEGRREGLRI